MDAKAGSTISRLRLPSKRPAKSADDEENNAKKALIGEFKRSSESDGSSNAKPTATVLPVPAVTFQAAALPVAGSSRNANTFTAQAVARRAKRRSIMTLNHKGPLLQVNNDHLLSRGNPTTMNKGVNKPSVYKPPVVRSSGYLPRSGAVVATSGRTLPPSRNSVSGGFQKSTSRSSLTVSSSSRSSSVTTIASDDQNISERLAYLENALKGIQQRGNLKSDLKNYAVEQETCNKELLQQLEHLKKQLQESNGALDQERRSRSHDERNMVLLQSEKTAVENDLQNAKAEIVAYRQTISQMTATNSVLSAQCDSQKVQLDQRNAVISEKDSTIAAFNERTRQLERNAEELLAKLRCGETERRKLHNLVQELKGNIRVFCRVRPFLPEETAAQSSAGALCGSHLDFPDSEKNVISLVRGGVGGVDMTLNESTVGAPGSRPGSFEFRFDRVFSPADGQVTVFEEISQLVQSALDGFNVCIFAYGQTGSGKTYTMEGPSSVQQHSAEAGMIHLSVRQIFNCANGLADKGWKYKFESSFIEIYNETLRDLLVSGSKADDVKLEIHPPPKGTTGDMAVSNLTVKEVHSLAEVEKLLEISRRNRAVAATKCNERSSRSHSVFRLKLTGRNSITTESCEGNLSLIDLAGSEKLKDSQSTGDRLKETQSINTSLSKLSTVIMQLANKEKHISYRDSKLTYLLQNSLGGNSKSLMFVNINPREEYFNETVNSLRFATKVNQCQIGTATKKVGK